MLGTAQILGAITPDIPLQALVNMYNSNLQDLSITASRKVPEFAEYWKKLNTFNKTSNVIDKEKKELGVDKIPKDAMERLHKMMDEAEASKDGLVLGEVGREIVHPNGRKEYVASGYTVNGQPVEPAVHPYLKLHYKNMSRSGFALTTDPYVSCRCDLQPRS